MLKVYSRKEITDQNKVIQKYHPIVLDIMKSNYSRVKIKTNGKCLKSSKIIRNINKNLNSLKCKEEEDLSEENN